MLETIASGVAIGLALMVIRVAVPERVLKSIRPWLALLAAASMVAAAVFFGWAFFSPEAGCSDCDEPAGRAVGIFFVLGALGMATFFGLRAWIELRPHR